MAKLTGETVASTYSLLLKVQTTGIHATTQRLIEDGDANPSALLMSEAGITSDGTLTVNGISTLTGAVTAPAGVTGALDGIVGGTTPAAVTGTTIDGVIGSVTPAAITGTTITGTTIGGTVITASTNFAGDITGDLTGNADTSTKVYVTDNESTDEENLVSFVADAAVASGNHGLEMDGNLTYNPSTGTLTTTAVASALTGDVTGDLTGEVTATGTLADGVTAATQTAGDDSTKVATTAYADAAAGTVLQVVYFDTDDATFTTAATASMVSIDTLEAAITPAHADNYILIQIMITFGPAYGCRAGFGISSSLDGQIGSSTQGTGSQRDAITTPVFNHGHSIAVISSANAYVQYRDSLSSWSTGAITYTATVNSDGGLYLNRPYSVSDSTNVIYGRSSITLTEIKG